MTKKRRGSPLPGPPGDPLLAKNPFAPLANPGPAPAATVPRKEKLPPFFVRSIEGNLKADLDALIKRGLKATMKLCTDGYKIIVPSKPHFNAVLEYLRQKKAAFFTHDIPADKPFKVVLRGLYEMQEGELTDYLSDCGLKVVAVHKIRRKETNTKFRDQLYLLHLEKGSTTLKDLKQIKAVANVVVEWEQYRPVHRDVTQCWKCLNFGHGGRNCFLASRCPNCGENHDQAQCAAEILVAKCCNCGGDHPSTDRACPKRAEFIQFRKNVAARKNNGRPKPTPINQESFPALPNRNRVPNLEPIPLPGLRPKPAPNPVPPGFQRFDPTPGVKPNPPGDGPRPRTKLLTAAELLNTFKIMYAKLMQCQTVEEQSMAVLEFTYQIVYG